MMGEAPATRPSNPEPSAEEPIELTVLARLAGVRLVHVRRYVEFGLLEPVNSRPTVPVPASRFDPASAARLARAERLRCDLKLNYAGAVLVVELLERIGELEARVARSPANPLERADQG